MKSFTSVWAGPISTESPSSRRGGKGSPTLRASAWGNKLFIKQSAERPTPSLSSPITNGYTCPANRPTKRPRAPSSSRASWLKSQFLAHPIERFQRGFARRHRRCPQNTLQCFSPNGCRSQAKIYLLGQKLVLLRWRYGSGHRYKQQPGHVLRFGDHEDSLERREMEQSHTKQMI